MAAPSEKSREEIHWTDPHFHRQVLEEGKRMAQMYPGYLRTKAEGEVTLSDTARKILRMQAEGDSMNKIAGQLGLAAILASELATKVFHLFTI